jgi:hypothetical protein
MKMIFLSLLNVYAFVGENTQAVQQNSKGKFVLIAEDTYNFNAGDTIYLSKTAVLVDGEYLHGGDYYAKVIGEGAAKMK